MNDDDAPQLAETLSDDLLKNVGPAAKFIGVKPRAVYHMVERNLIPHFRVGKDIWFRKSELRDRFRSNV